MPSLLFYFFAAITLLFGAGVVVARNPVASAMSLVVSFVGLAALFISLDAYFIGTLQILVYAGAVMVLFLFIIMLLDLKEEERRRLNAIAVGLGSVAVLGLAGVLLRALIQAKPVIGAGTQPVEGSTKELGRILFQSYLLPFEILSILLLVAMVGVILLSKKEMK